MTRQTTKSRLGLAAIAAIAGGIGCENFAFASNYSNAILATPGLSAYWQLNETVNNGTATTWTDSSGNGHTGTQTNNIADVPVLGIPGPSPANGFPGFDVGNTADSFNREQSILVADSPSLNPGTGDFTMEAWFQTTSNTGTLAILGKETDGYTDGYLMMTNWWDVVNHDAAARFRDVNDNEISPPSPGFSTIGTGGGWHYIAAVLHTDGGGPNYNFSGMSVYLDGTLAGVVNSTILDGADITNTENLAIGAANQDGSVGFVGGLADVALYSTALSANQITAHYDAALTAGAASLFWNNTSGTGNGTLWDTVQQNWNNGTAAAVYADGSNVTFNDSNNDHYAVTLNTAVSPASITVDNSAGNYTISGSGSIAGRGPLAKSGSGTLTLSTANTYSGGTTVNAGVLEIAPTSTPSTTISALAKGAVTITGGTLQLGANVTSGSQVGPTPASNVNIISLSISGNGTLDINNNHVIIDYTPGNDPISSIAAWIQAGYNNGAWNGPGITSTAAANNASSYGIGYSDAADPGNPAGLASGQIEIKYTLLGDANLDGSVNGSDFAILASNFNKAVSGWDAGDFNYDGSANGADFALLASNFNKGASQSSVADLQALDSFETANDLNNVPEPVSAGMILMVGLGIITRRQRTLACRSVFRC